MKAIHVIAFVLLVIGGLNWLLIGIWNYDVVANVLGAGTTGAKVVYILVGLSAIVALLTHRKDCKGCTTM